MIGDITAALSAVEPAEEEVIRNQHNAEDVSNPEREDVGTSMTFMETPLGERLATGLELHQLDVVVSAVDDIVDSIWSVRIDASAVTEVVAELQRYARFAEIIPTADAAMATGTASIETRRRYAQALIETRALRAAEMELTSLLAFDGLSPAEKGELLGSLGRLRKQRFVLGGRVDDLWDAVAAYRLGYERGTDPVWHGVNLVALTGRAVSDGHPLPDGTPTPSDLASSLLATMRDRPSDQRTIWERAAEVELHVALGATDRARSVAEGLAPSRAATPFALTSLRRQLTEIWQLEPTDPILVALDNRILQFGGGAIVDVPSSPEDLERIFGTARPVEYAALRRGLHCAESVCKITNAAGTAFGTGFLAAGSVFGSDLDDSPILVTNAHVVSSLPGEGVLLPNEALARFDVLRTDSGEPVVLGELTEIWSSPQRECDVTLLRFSAPVPAVSQPIEPAPALPRVTEGSFVYVIGHPAGGELQLSIRGNDLLGYDDPPVRTHYRAPTEPGSSGSPVFTDAWQLMAVHHAGSPRMPRLDNRTETYEANEGITLEAIRSSYDRTKVRM